MKLKPLGNTDRLVSPIGLGLAALGRPGYINLGHGEDLAGLTDVNHMEANAHSVLDEAWEHGIRYVDTARSYGKAELFLNSWLRRRASPARSSTWRSRLVFSSMICA